MQTKVPPPPPSPSQDIIKTASGKYTPMVTETSKPATPPVVAPVVAPVTFPQPAPKAKIDCIFDSNKYYNAYPDVKAAGMDAVQHYTIFGIKEGRSPCGIPNCAFDHFEYYNYNPDVKAAGMDAAQHYTIYGIKEGRLVRKCTV